MPQPRLRLRPFRSEDEFPAVTAHAAMLADDGFPLLLTYSSGERWDGYLARLVANRVGLELPDGWVPHSFLAAVVDGELVGRASIRHGLNDWLADYMGHIGYGVIADHRRKGYAGEILRQSLIIARSLGVDDVLVTCDTDNIGSARVIESCGGEFESVIAGNGEDAAKRRYWFR